MAAVILHFESREVPRYAEPITPQELREGDVYFAVRFKDDKRFIPTMYPLVYLGRGLRPDLGDRFYFQDVGSYVQHGSAVASKIEGADLYAQLPDQLKDIFTYERALDRLLCCSLRRRGLA